MKSIAAGLIGLLVGVDLSQMSQPGTTVAGEMIQLDMSRQQAL
jgi:hypothetical protein